MLNDKTNNRQVAILNEIHSSITEKPKLLIPPDSYSLVPAYHLDDNEPNYIESIESRLIPIWIYLE